MHFGVAPFPIDRGDYLSNLHRHGQLIGQKTLMTYAAYCQLNCKSGNSSLKCLFLKQLLCIRMITAERALLIVERFPTPRHLRQLYRDLPDDRARLEYFKDLRMEGSGMKFGPQASRNLCEVFYGAIAAPPKKRKASTNDRGTSQTKGRESDCVIIL